MRRGAREHEALERVGVVRFSVEHVHQQLRVLFALAVPRAAYAKGSATGTRKRSALGARVPRERERDAHTPSTLALVASRFEPTPHTSRPVVARAAALLGDEDVLRVEEIAVLRSADRVDHARLEVQQQRARDLRGFPLDTPTRTHQHGGPPQNQQATTREHTPDDDDDDDDDNNDVLFWSHASRVAAATSRVAFFNGESKHSCRRVCYGRSCRAKRSSSAW